MLQAMFSRIGVTQILREFGIQDGCECNSRYLVENDGWSGCEWTVAITPYMSGRSTGEFVAAENVCSAK